MRKLLPRCLILFIILTLLPCAALADNAFVQDGKKTALHRAALNCHFATNQSTTVYADKYLTQPITTIPARTFVNNTPSGADFYAHEVEIRENNGTTYEHNVWGALYVSYITYPDGRQGTGWIDNRTLTSAYSQNGQHLLMVRLQLDGEYDKDLYGQEIDDNDPVWGDMSSDAPIVWTPGEDGDTEDTPAEADDIEDEASTTKTNKTSSSKTKKSQTTTSQSTAVSISQLGVYKSVIMVGEEEKEVLTRELTFAEDVPEDKRIAVIYAPKTGKCSLREKASDSGKLIKKCKAGHLVYVLEYGKKYCRINYNGEEGWVLTSCLNFFDADAEPIGTGTLTYNGKATGRTTINVRNDADGDSTKIAEWKTGTKVKVFALDDGWYEIEYDGMHGYVMQKFLTIDE